MLPEKRKKLIIGIVAVILLIILIFGLASLSSYIKGRSTRNEMANDSYPSKYSYLGVMKDDTGVYQIVGLDDDFDETFLDIHTFYNVQDVLVKNNRLILYSDAVNELRYDSIENKFYFYEINSYYSNNVNVKLARDYIVFYKDKKISYWSNEESEKNEKIITSNNVGKNIFVNENFVYYTLSDGIYQYNLDTMEEKLIVVSGEYTSFDLVTVSDKYAFLTNNEHAMVKLLDKDTLLNLRELIKDEKEITFIGFTSDGFIYMVKEQVVNDANENSQVKWQYILKKYSLLKMEVLDYSYNLDSEYIVISKVINEFLLDASLVDEQGVIRNVILDLNKKEVVKEFDKNYLYIVGIGENEN